MKTLFVVADAARGAAVGTVASNAVVVADRPVLLPAAEGDRLTPDGERLVAGLKEAGKVVLVLDAGNPDDRLAAALFVAARQAGVDTGRFWLVRPVAWAADPLAAALAVPKPLAEEVAPLLVRRRFARRFRHHLQRLLGTGHGPQGLALTPETLLLIFLLVGRQEEIRMFARPVAKTLLADLDGGGEARLVGGPDDGDDLERLAGAVANRPARVVAVTEQPCLLPPPPPCSFPELLADAWRSMRLGPGDTAGLCRRLVCFLDRAGKVQALLSSPWAAQEQIASLAASLSRGEAPPEVHAGVLLPMEPEDGVPDLDSGPASLYRLVRERFAAACAAAVEGVRFEGELECGGRRWRFVRQAPAAAVAARLEVGGTVTFGACRLADADPPVVAPHDYASLADEIRDFGLALDAGLATLLQEMTGRGYLRLSPEGALLPEGNSEKVARIMDRAFPAMRGINLSAYLEQTVTEVLTGRKDLEFALHQFDATLHRQGKVLVAPKVGDLLQRRHRSANVIKGEQLPAGAAARPAVLPGEPAPGTGAGEEGGAEDSGGESPAAEAGEAALDAGQVAEQGEEAALLPEGGQEEDGAGGSLPGDEDTDSSRVGGVGEPDGTDADPDGAPGSLPVDAAGTAEGTDLLAAAPPPVPEQPVSEPEGEEDGGEAGRDRWPAVSGDDDGLREEGGSREHVAGGPPLPEEDAAAPSVRPDDAAVQTRPCPACGRPMVLSRDRFGEFWKCTGFPACRHQEAAGGEAAGGEAAPCPLCGGGDVLAKATPSGRTLYVCSRPECRFMAWGQPHPEPCPVCGSPYLVEKRGAEGGMELRCPRAGCRYRRGLQAPEETPAAGEAAAGSPSPAPKKKKRRIRVVRRRKK